MTDDTTHLFDLSGQTAVVTGAGKGIGRELALGLAGAGANVVVASRTVSDVESVASSIRQLGREALAHQLDVTDEASIDELTRAAVAKFDRVDVLVNCAGRVVLSSSLDLTPEEWDSILDTNLKGLFFCCQSIARVMVAQGSGRIINIASALGLVGLDKRAAYCASKGGVVQLTRALAVEWAPHNVTVNAIAPTTTLTGETAGFYADPVLLAEKTRDIPMRRLGTAGDLVGAAVYLASAASRFVTGHILTVDGGYTIR